MALGEEVDACVSRSEMRSNLGRHDERELASEGEVRGSVLVEVNDTGRVDLLVKEGTGEGRQLGLQVNLVKVEGSDSLRAASRSACIATPLESQEDVL